MIKTIYAYFLIVINGFIGYMIYDSHLNVDLELGVMAMGLFMVLVFVPVINFLMYQMYKSFQENY